MQPFGNMTTLQNAMVGTFCKHSDYKDAEQIAMSALKTVGLENKKDSVAKILNLEERKKLKIAKAQSLFVCPGAQSGLLLYRTYRIAP